MRKDIGDYQWSLGNGQCPVCLGNRPGMGWWTDRVGHNRGCALGQTMEAAGLEVFWSRLNPERSVGWYNPDYPKGGPMCTIRFNDPDKGLKLELQKQQAIVRGCGLYNGKD